MPQGPISVATGAGGSSSALQVNATGVIKGSAGRLAKLLVQTPGSAGNIVLNDAATVAGANASNQILSLAFNAVTDVAGGVISLDWPCANGIVVSAITTGGVFAVSYT
jgi:hypothetical protein